MTLNNWHRLGAIVEMLPHKQYKVKVDGSGPITVHKRWFLCHITSQSNINQTASVTVILPSNLGIISNPNIQRKQTTVPQKGKILPSTSTDPLNNPSGYPAIIHETAMPNLQPTRTPIIHCIQALNNLANFNKPGLKEWRNSFHGDITNTLPHTYCKEITFCYRYPQCYPWEGEM